jgi:hypothetical protein
LKPLNRTISRRALLGPFNLEAILTSHGALQPANKKYEIRIKYFQINFDDNELLAYFKHYCNVKIKALQVLIFCYQFERMILLEGVGFSVQ